jgi:Ca2+-transporting ATPase
MTKFIFFLLSTNVAEVFVILLTVLCGLPTPLTPIQILYLNLATDGFPAVALAVEEGESGLMDEGPRPLTEPLIEKVQKTGIIIQTFLLTNLVFWTYVLGLYWHTGTWNGEIPEIPEGLDPALFQPVLDQYNDGIVKAQTMAILLIVFAELGRAYSSRSLRQSVFDIGFFSNSMMQYSVGASVLGTILVGFVPGINDLFGCTYLDGRSYAVVFIFALLPFTVDEVTKYFYRRTGFGLRPKMNVYSRD